MINRDSKGMHDWLVLMTLSFRLESCLRTGEVDDAAEFFAGFWWGVVGEGDLDGGEVLGVEVGLEALLDGGLLGEFVWGDLEGEF